MDPVRLAGRMGRRRRSPAAAVPYGDRPPQVAGHDVAGPVGFGANGAVWAARDQAGRDVVVSVLALPAGEAGAAQLRRLAALRHGTHPHLARIRQVLPLDFDRCAVVSDRVRGPTLATVVAARGGLEPAELAALLSGVGSALGHLHERGVVHGDVSPANVVVTDEGVPVLVDLAGQTAGELGTPGFVPPERRRGSAAGAPGDVWALARLVEWAAGGRPEPRLRALLAPGRDTDPAHRPAARDLASRAPGIAPAAPITVPPPPVLAQARMRDDDVALTRRRASTRRALRAAAGKREKAPSVAAGRRGDGPPVGACRRGEVPATAAGRGQAPPGAAARRGDGPSATAGRRGKGPATAGRRGSGPGTAARHVRRHHVPTPWLGAAVSLGAAAALAGAVLWVVPEDGAATHHQGPRPAEHADALTRLLDRRDQALVTGDADALGATTVPGGPASREDAALLELLGSSGTVLEGLNTRVVGLVDVTPAAEGVVVDAVLVQDAHRRSVGGTEVTVPAQDPRCTRFVLVPAPEEHTPRILRWEQCP